MIDFGEEIQKLERKAKRLQIEIFNEEQFRARLTTLMQGKSPDLDVYMSLTSREGAIFEKAGSRL